MFDLVGKLNVDISLEHSNGTITCQTETLQSAI